MAEQTAGYWESMAPGSATTSVIRMRILKWMQIDSFHQHNVVNSFCMANENCIYPS